MKTKITKQEYLALEGLRALSNRHIAALQDIQETAAEIIGEPKGEFNHASDFAFDEKLTPDRLLAKLSIAVEDGSAE